MDEHKHKHDTLKVLRLMKIDNPDYQGTPGDMAFLAYQCECKDLFIFDYGKYRAIREKYTTLKAKEGEAKDERSEASN